MDPDPEQAKPPSSRRTATGHTSVHSDVPAYRVDKARIKAIARTVCTLLGVEGHELSISFVDSAAIRALNRDFRCKDKATDVLSFPQREFSRPVTLAQPHAAPTKSRTQRNGPPDALGDLVISLPEAALNAKTIRQDLAKEVCFLMVHGLLHLCGHDHEKAADERLMLAEQRLIMAAIGDRWSRCVTMTEVPH